MIVTNNSDENWRDLMLFADFTSIVVGLRVNSSIHIHILLGPLWRGGFGPPPHQVPQHKQFLLPLRRPALNFFQFIIFFRSATDHFSTSFDASDVHSSLIWWLLPLYYCMFFLYVPSCLTLCSLFSFTLHLQDGLNEPWITGTEDFTTRDSFSTLYAFFEGH